MTINNYDDLIKLRKEVIKSFVKFHKQLGFYLPYKVYDKESGYFITSPFYDIAFDDEEDKRFVRLQPCLDFLNLIDLENEIAVKKPSYETLLSGVISASNKYDVSDAFGSELMNNYYFIRSYLKDAEIRLCVPGGYHFPMSEGTSWALSAANCGIHFDDALSDTNYDSVMAAYTHDCFLEAKINDDFMQIGKISIAEQKETTKAVTFSISLEKICALITGKSFYECEEFYDDKIANTVNGNKFALSLFDILQAALYIDKEANIDLYNRYLSVCASLYVLSDLSMADLETIIAALGHKLHLEISRLTMDVENYIESLKEKPIDYVSLSPLECRAIQKLQNEPSLG